MIVQRIQRLVGVASSVPAPNSETTFMQGSRMALTVSLCSSFRMRLAPCPDVLGSCARICEWRVSSLRNGRILALALVDTSLSSRAAYPACRARLVPGAVGRRNSVRD